MPKSAMVARLIHIARQLDKPGYRSRAGGALVGGRRKPRRKTGGALVGGRRRKRAGGYFKKNANDVYFEKKSRVHGYGKTKKRKGIYNLEDIPEGAHIVRRRLGTKMANKRKRKLNTYQQYIKNNMRKLYEINVATHGHRSAEAVRETMAELADHWHNGTHLAFAQQIRSSKIAGGRMRRRHY